MGHIFPACSVSNEMVEIFVENAWFFESFAVRKTDTGPGLAGGSYLGRQAESCQPPAVSMERGDLLVWNVRSMGAPWWFPWARLDLNSRQYWLLKRISKKGFVYFAKQHTRQASVYLHVLFVWQVQPPGDLEATWIVYELTIFLKKFFWTDSVGAKPCDAPMNKY